MNEPATQRTPRSVHRSPALRAVDPWPDPLTSLRSEIADRPYESLLVAAGLGGLLAGRVTFRLLPRLLQLGVRVAVASTLPTLAAVARELLALDLRPP